jgi:hypothetical protein
MAQISKGDTFVDGEQVTGYRLNQLVDSAQLLVGAITDQPSITANTLQATDSTIVNDAGVLKEATIGDILNSNLPVTTSSINGVTGSDIVVTPAAGQKFDVNGAFEANSINSTGALTVGGNATVTGNLTVAGDIGGNINTSGNITNSGTANFTGTFQFNGSAVYALSEITEYTPSTWVAIVGGYYEALWTSPSFTKPSDELWIFEASFHYSGKKGYNFDFAGRYGSQTARTGSYLFVELFTDGAGGGSHTDSTYTTRWIVPAGTAIASDTFKLDVFVANGSEVRMFNTTPISNIVTTGTVAASKFRIYKYKTA